MRKARIRLTGSEPKLIADVCNQLARITERTNVQLSGPIPLPTRVLKVPVQKAPDGEGNATWDRWEMRIHKRLVEIDADERTMRQIMRVRIPDGVNVEIELTT